MTTTDPPTSEAPHARLRSWHHGLAVFLCLHGVAHFAGTADSFAQASDGGAVRYLGGAWTVSDPITLRLLGAAWAVAGVSWLVVALRVWRNPSTARLPLTGVTAASLGLSAVALWGAWIGVAINVVLLATVRRRPEVLLGELPDGAAPAAPRQA